ncbi:MAG TPA: phosphosulfolactate synthase [Thermoplasmata archaeon]|nr:phosphosulfolactate synthase [Thermoplasmata archaeon]
MSPKTSSKAWREQERAFSWVKRNDRQGKPRTKGLTEIRGPYYSVMGPRYLEDVLETAGDYVDSLKFAAGSFSLIPKKSLTRLLDLAHSYDVQVSTGGWVEYVLTQGKQAVDRYIEEVKSVGFDILELSAGFISLPIDDWVALVERTKDEGLKPKPEVGIQWGAGGETSVEELEEAGVRDPGRAIHAAKRFLEAGAYLIMIESEGITENVKAWRTDVVSQITDALGTEKVMFEAADPQVFTWYVQNYGADVNLFVDHSQIIQLEIVRRGIWGMAANWGRIVTYKP